MSEEKTKVDCHLTARGTDKANADAIEDLAVPDPEPVVGEQIIKDAIEDEEENDSES
jgi:hypothetical protein